MTHHKFVECTFYQCYDDATYSNQITREEHIYEERNKEEELTI